MTLNDYPPREKAVMNTDKIETPEKPVLIDPYAKPEAVSQELWDTLTDQQKKAQITTHKAIKIHAEKYGGI